MAKKTDKRARSILRNAVLKARHVLLTDATDLLAVCDELGEAFEQAEGHWPTEDEQEAAE